MSDKLDSTGARTDKSRTKSSELNYRENLDNIISNSSLTNIEKFQNFPKFIPTPDLRKFICKEELYKKIIDVHGVIIEGGVLYGGGLLTWGQLSEIYEPFNYTRKIFGFDTFEGFKEIHDKDKKSISSHLEKGKFAWPKFEELENEIELFEKSKVLNHINKISLIKGDVKKTIDEFVEENPYLVISLLYLDFDLYEPTLEIIKKLYPFMPKGSIIAFDELCNDLFVGETIAVLETIGINNLRIKRFEFGVAMSYAVIE
jgi:hypothetical protein|tara:strand:- start:1449 stop:2222 length:774 start_codon:yes stop_codon:yes gene_type:complete